MRIINLTQHVATPEQVAEGVFEPKNKPAVLALLSFGGVPSLEEVDNRAIDLADYAIGEMPAPSTNKGALIGGAPFLMSALERRLKGKGIRPLYSFTERISVDETQGDTVKKISVFRHAGWVEV